MITGNGGANVLNGLVGADTMSGGAGSDTYYVDNVGDRALEANGAAGTDLVYASVSYSLAGAELEALVLTGAGNLTGTGNSIANTLTGNGGANVLDGQGGNDLMTGGAGADTFVFRTALGPSNLDRIADFSVIDDTVQLARSVFTALGAGPLAEAAFKDLSTGAADAGDRILPWPRRRSRTSPPERPMPATASSTTRRRGPCPTTPTAAAWPRPRCSSPPSTPRPPSRTSTFSSCDGRAHPIFRALARAQGADRVRPRRDRHRQPGHPDAPKRPDARLGCHRPAEPDR
ncbi:calcium-binding protein [Methylobacterium sp. Leaf108]|uniref:calcium-binding protein n=1 Tax=Methylobacterium sp. Leaf108 TaxID=1736256 RepID=UPI0006FE3C42|nr:calcium-binding protein [Methylobacterium sp. Leaf108]KQP54192.1 hypothetical protein ASF39_19650 [Methylobacterium sp. Leaf108]